VVGDRILTCFGRKGLRHALGLPTTQQIISGNAGTSRYLAFSGDILDCFRVCFLVAYLLRVSMICAMRLWVNPGWAFSAPSKASLRRASASITLSSLWVFNNLDSAG